MDIKACFICRQYGLNKCICDTKEGRYTLYYNAPLTCEERRFLCLNDAERKEFAIRVENEPLSPYIIEILKDIKERKASCPNSDIVITSENRKYCRQCTCHIDYIGE